MFAPGKPGLSVNVTVDEIVRYSPKWMDVIDLEENAFVTVDAAELMAELGDHLPLVRQIVSIHEHGQIRKPTLVDTDLNKEDLVITFDGLMKNTHFVR